MTVKELIEELQKHDPNMPVSLEVSMYDNPEACVGEGRREMCVEMESNVVYINAQSEK